MSEGDDGARLDVPGAAQGSDQQLLTPLLAGRRSPSVFDGRHVVGDHELSRLLHAAQWSASFGNTQPWAYVVARRGTSAHDVVVAQLTHGNSGWVPAASVVLVGATRVGALPGEKPATGDYALYDLGQAAVHITVQARAMGLEAHQFAGFDHSAAAEQLGVPDHYRVVAAIAIGRPGDLDTAPPELAERDRRPRRRRPLETFAFDGCWGRGWGGPRPASPPQ